MYRIDDKPEAIRSVQRYLVVAGNPHILIAPTGVYDENTRLSVEDFQSRKGLVQSGVVDYETFTLLYDDYVFITDREALNQKLDSFVNFPLYPGEFDNAMLHINRSLARILDYYGFTHRLRSSNFYSDETSNAVKTLRQIYLLEDSDVIDEEFYIRMIKDHDSIGKFNNNFR